MRQHRLRRFAGCLPSSAFAAPMQPLDSVCRSIPAAPPRSRLLPGGVSWDASNLVETVQPALSPLVPVFNSVDANVAVFNAIKAIPEMIGPPPDPTVLGPALAELASRVAVRSSRVQPTDAPDRSDASSLLRR